MANQTILCYASRMQYIGVFFALISAVIFMADMGSSVAQEGKISVRGSNLEIPRFVTLKSSKVNMRAGPGREYPVKWYYQRRGLPLKVIGEFDVWRKVEDHEGASGWVHVSTLSVRRMALMLDTATPIHDRADGASPIIAIAEAGVILEIDECLEGWCRLKKDAVDGWVNRKSLWGLLESEELN